MNSSTESLIITEEKTDIKDNEPWHIVFHNDNITSFDLVILVMISVLGKSEEEAVGLAYKVHNEGRSVVASYHFEIAEQKTAECMQVARNFGAPLLVTMQK